MGLLTNILLAPFLGPVWGTRWTLEKVDQVVREDESALCVEATVAEEVADRELDATIVDAVAQVMGAPTRLWTWAVASAHAIPLLCGFEAIRVVQALIDRTGADVVSTVVGFAEFGVIGVCKKVFRQYAPVSLARSTGLPISAAASDRNVRDIY